MAPAKMRIAWLAALTLLASSVCGQASNTTTVDTALRPVDATTSSVSTISSISDSTVETTSSSTVSESTPSTVVSTSVPSTSSSPSATPSPSSSPSASPSSSLELSTSLSSTPSQTTAQSPSPTPSSALSPNSPSNTPSSSAAPSTKTSTSTSASVVHSSSSAGRPASSSLKSAVTSTLPVTTSSPPASVSSSASLVSSSTQPESASPIPIRSSSSSSPSASIVPSPSQLSLAISSVILESTGSLTPAASSSIGSSSFSSIYTTSSSSIIYSTTTFLATTVLPITTNGVATDTTITSLFVQTNHASTVYMPATFTTIIGPDPSVAGESVGASSSGGLSTGAKAGIGAGIGLVVVAALAFGFWYSWYSRQRRHSQAAGSDKYSSASYLGGYGGVAEKVPTHTGSYVSEPHSSPLGVPYRSPPTSTAFSNYFPPSVASAGALSVPSRSGTHHSVATTNVPTQSPKLNDAHGGTSGDSSFSTPRLSQPNAPHGYGPALPVPQEHTGPTAGEPNYIGTQPEPKVLTRNPVPPGRWPPSTNF